MTRGKGITQEDLHTLINSLDIPDDARQRLLELTPHNYIGNANIQASNI